MIESRVGCVDCHKADFGGGAIFDNAPMGRWVAPNLTSGKGSVTKDYKTSDWDRILRHGVRKDGTAAAELTAAVWPGEYHRLVITRQSSGGVRGPRRLASHRRVRR